MRFIRAFFVFTLGEECRSGRWGVGAVNDGDVPWWSVDRRRLSPNSVWRLGRAYGLGIIKGDTGVITGVRGLS